MPADRQKAARNANISATLVDAWVAIFLDVGSTPTVSIKRNQWISNWSKALVYQGFFYFYHFIWFYWISNIRSQKRIQEIIRC